MTDDLIARLKRLHKGVTSSGVLYLRGSTVAEIIAALEERERMRAVVEAARKGLTGLRSRYIEHGVEAYAHFCMDLRVALDAMEEKP